MLASFLLASTGSGPRARAVAHLLTRPADGVFHFEGRGWGHGRGLNQWGAQGRALHGAKASQILDAYYPGTTERIEGPRGVRILIVEDDGRDLRVSGRGRMSAVDTATSRRYALPAAEEWRVTPTARGLVLRRLVAGQWLAWLPRGDAWFRGPLRLTSTMPLRLLLDDGSWREYRGALEAAWLAPTKIATVNRLSLERYLYAVVSQEMPKEFAPAALEAQAVAARTYALNRITAVRRAGPWDLCSSSWDCQTYRGMKWQRGGKVRNLEHDPARAAVDATRGRVRVFRDRVIYAEFSASNGGRTSAWFGWPPRPYLPSNEDPWDAISPHHMWRAQVSAAQIEARYPAIRHLTAIEVLQRDGAGDWGGRVLTLRLHGTGGPKVSIDVTGEDFFWVAPWPLTPGGLRSNWWTVSTP